MKMFRRRMTGSKLTYKNRTTKMCPRYDMRRYNIRIRTVQNMRKQSIQTLTSIVHESPPAIFEGMTVLVTNDHSIQRIVTRGGGPDMSHDQVGIYVVTKIPQVIIRPSWSDEFEYTTSSRRVGAVPVTVTRR